PLHSMERGSGGEVRLFADCTLRALPLPIGWGEGWGEGILPLHRCGRDLASTALGMNCFHDHQARIKGLAYFPDCVSCFCLARCTCCSGDLARSSNRLCLASAATRSRMSPFASGLFVPPIPRLRCDIDRTILPMPASPAIGGFSSA